MADSVTPRDSRLTPAPIAVPEVDLDDLRDRLRRTRWPERETVDDWSQGIPLAYVQDLCETWAEEYDWRRCEAELNRYEQVRFRAAGPSGAPLGIQVLHAPSPEPSAIPVVFTHGWPGSVVEFLDVVDALRDPAAHGGAAEDAFHVVCPSLPGYGFSDRPAETGWGVDHIADQWAALMAALGYERFGAQGGDWGSAVTTRIGAQHPDRCIGIHLNMVSAGPGSEPEGAHRGRAGRPRLARALPPVGQRLLDPAGHPTADGRVRARRLAGRAGGLDRGEVLVVVRPPGPPRGLVPRGSGCSTTSCTTGSRAPAPRPGGSTGRASGRSGAATWPYRRGCPSSPRRSSVRPAGGPSGGSRTSATGTSSTAAGTSPPSSGRSTFVDEVRAFFRLVR